MLTIDLQSPHDEAPALSWVTRFTLAGREPIGAKYSALLLLEGELVAAAEANFSLAVAYQGSVVKQCDPWLEDCGAGEVPPGAKLYRFRCELGLLGYPQDFSLEVGIQRAGQAPVTAATLGVRRMGDLPTSQSELAPILVTSHGRSGSSLFMKELGRHPAILVNGSHPYETRAANYWLHTLGVLTAPADHNAALHPGRFHSDPGRTGKIHSDPGRTGPFPENTFSRSGNQHQLQNMRASLLEKTVGFCTENIQDFYAAVAGDQDKPQAQYFAEKSLPGHVPLIAEVVYPNLKEVILVRDLRDIACSMRAFAEKRGRTSFGGVGVSDWQSMIDEMVPGAERMLEHWLVRRSRALLVRYEDFLADHAGAMRRVFEYLDLDAPADAAAAPLETAEADGHRSSDTDASSIGRWKKDMAPDIAGLSEERFGPMLRAFGYVD